MAGNLIEKGDVIDVIVTGTITSGTAMLIGTKLGVALGSGVNGDHVRFALVGVWKLPKATGASRAQLQGTVSYWDDTAKKMTNVSSGNTAQALAFEVSADNDAFGIYRLNN